jgi:hypothetical protein
VVHGRNGTLWNSARTALGWLQDDSHQHLQKIDSPDHIKMNVINDELVVAAFQNRLSAVEQAIEEGADLTHKNGAAILWAMRYGHHEIADRLRAEAAAQKKVVDVGLLAALSCALPRPVCAEVYLYINNSCRGAHRESYRAATHAALGL